MSPIEDAIRATRVTVVDLVRAVVRDELRRGRPGTAKGKVARLRKRAAREDRTAAMPARQRLHPAHERARVGGARGQSRLERRTGGDDQCRSGTHDERTADAMKSGFSTLNSFRFRNRTDPSGCVLALISCRARFAASPTLAG